MRGESGQAAVEWTAVVLLVAVALAAAATLAPAAGGRPLGAAVLHALVCAVRERCGDERAELVAAYGRRDAALVRRHAPNLAYERGAFAIPVDYRRCRSHRCADAPDDPDLDVHRSRRGAPATAFTRVMRRDGRTYVQYWLYYPDSASSFLGSRRLTRHLPDDPFHHPDDWEAYAVRIDPDGRVWARATSHGHWQWCKQRRCRGRWGRGTGWTRVSRGSHAGHIPLAARIRRLRFELGRGPRRGPGATRRPRVRVEWRYRRLAPGAGLRERSTTAPGIRLVPAERLDHRRYRPLDPGISPPWRKRAWVDPEAPAS